MKIQTNNTQQPLFINHTVHTKSLLYESITVFHRIILGWIACYSFSILFLILAYCSFHYFHLILLFLIFTLSAILIPIFWFLLPYQSIHKIYKKNTFLYQSDIIEYIYFFEDYIEIYNLCNHSHMQYHYSEFSFVAHTTHLIVLANTQTHLLINKNGFYKGTLIDFLNFISMKRGKNCNEFKYFI